MPKSTFPSLVAATLMAALPASAQTAQQLDGLVNCLEIEVQTGDDDFRADSRLFADAVVRPPGSTRNFTTDTQLVWSRAMGDRTSIRVNDYCFTPEQRVSLRQIGSVRLGFGAGSLTQGIILDLGSVSADNWNLDRVVIRATFTDPSIPEFEIADRSGTPLQRFERDRRRVLTVGGLQSFQPN